MKQKEKEGQSQQKIVKLFQQDLFPRVYCKVENQQNNEAQNFFIESKKMIQSKPIIFNHEDHITVLTKLSPERLNKFSFIYLCDHGSIVVLERQEPFEQTHVNLIFPKRWDFQIYNLRQQTKFMACSPNQFEVIQIGTMLFSNYEIERQKDQYQKYINGIIQKARQKLKNKEPKNHKTPTWLLQVCRQALNFFNQNNQNLNEVLLSKGGTLDVGWHIGITKPNTIIYVVEALYGYLLADYKLLKLLKMQLKFKYIQLSLNVEQMKRSEIKNQKKIISIFIQELKNLFNEQIQYDEKRVSKELEKVIKKIETFYLSKKRARFQVKELKKDIQDNNLNRYGLQFYQIQHYSKLVYQKINFNGDLGTSICLGGVKNFSDLLRDIAFNEGTWVLRVQQFMFGIANNVLNQDEININIQLSEVICSKQVQMSILHQVIKKYQNIITLQNNLKKIGFLLQNQQYCHLYLIKYIGAVISFEVVKKHRKNKLSNLEIYTIPHYMPQLYQSFYSLSYEARQAVKSMLQYCFRNFSKEELFTLENSNKSFEKYSLSLYSEQKTFQKWIQSMEQKLRKQKQSLAIDFATYKSQYQKENRRNLQLSSRKCYCEYKYDIYDRYRKYECQRCIDLQNSNYQLQLIRKKQAQYIISPLPESTNGKIIYSFLANIPNDILGMMKLIYENQISIPSNLFPNNYTCLSNYSILKNYGQLSATFSQIKKKKLSLLINHNKDVSEFIIYPPKNTINIYNNEYQKVPINKNFLAVDTLPNKNLHNVYKQVLKNPKKLYLSRQHQIYANIPKKPLEERLQQYLSFSNVRVTQQTELINLSLFILNRQINSSMLIKSVKLTQQKDKQKYTKMLIIFNALANLNAFAKYQNGKIYKYSIINESIEQCLKKYTQAWRFEDLYFLHISGVYFSLLSLQFNTPSYAINLAKTAFSEYQKFVKQNKVADSSIMSQRAYFLHSAFACFVQRVTDTKDKLSCHLLLKILILYRNNKVYSDQNIKDPRYRETMVFYDHFRERAIFKNIQNVLQYFQNHSNELTEIAQLMDNSISSNCKWKYNISKGYYVFSGVAQQDRYDINLFNGILLKNGKQQAGLPEVIKKNKDFQTIFGKNRDLQVYTQADGFLRTRSDFSFFFDNEPKSKFFFQFKIKSQNEVIIRKIIKNEQQEQFVYILIPLTYLQKNNFVIPQLYSKQYSAWYCEKQNAIIFRSKQINNLKDIGLVMLTKRFKQQKSNKEIIQLVQTRIIENQFKKQKRQFLIDPKNQHYFPLLKIFKNNQNTPLAFRILSCIENEKFILQIYSNIQPQESFQNRKIKFWLHRYDLKFTYIQNNGLASDNYQGYAINDQYKHINLLPWGPEDKISCLVLKKMSEDLRTLKMHNYIVLIPDLKVLLGKQKFYISSQVTQQIKICSYEIHDHFKDLRSKSRLHQLHMACLISSTQKPTIFRPLMMSNVEYALSILRSCISVKPLTQQQQAKLENLLKNAFQRGLTTIILMSKIIFKASNLLSDILPFQNHESNMKKKDKIKPQNQKDKIKPENQKDNIKLFDRFEDQIKNHLTIYFKNLRQNLIPQRQKLTFSELKIINVNNIPIQYKKKSKWNISNPLRFFLTGQTPKLINKTQQARKRYAQLIKDLLNNYRNNQNKHYKDFSSEIVTKLQFKQKCQMSKEQKDQIQQSLTSYYEFLYKWSDFNLNDQKKKQLMKKILTISLEFEKLKNKVLNHIDQLQYFNSYHLDVLSEARSIIKQRDFTEILCDQDYIYSFYPDINEYQLSLFKLLILQWMKLTTATESQKRIYQILKDSIIDKISLLRQMESPREQVEKQIPWLCFQVEMKIQIWASQYETYQLFRKSTSGTVSQLNMGEGKTQVIIPMLVLNYLYDKQHSKLIPKVNILSSLYKEAQTNYFKFLSVTGFRISCFPIYFNRQVQINQISLKKMILAVHLFKRKTLFMIDRESSLSFILKIRQQISCHYQFISVLKKYCGQNYDKKDGCIFRDMHIIDIYDQVDAMMTPKKSFVYALGGSTPLPSSRIRFQMISILIQIIVKELLQFLLDEDIAVLQTSLQKAQESIRRGQFANGLRFLVNVPQEKIIKFRKLLVDYFFSESYLPPEFQFIKGLKLNQKCEIQNYLVDPSFQLKKIQSVPELALDQILVVRGIISYGILQHCLTLRVGVDYGVPGKTNLKRVGVPYESADIPSKRSQYSHPDVAAILSYFSYFRTGLSQNQFGQTLKYLLCQTQSSQSYSFKQWLKSIEKQEVRPKQILQVKQINIESKIQIDELYNCFRYCRSTIIYWLTQCVFPIDLRQYLKSITASCWDLASSAKSLGFSGTKDTHWLLPNYLSFKNSDNSEISGTDGKMIHLMLENTLKIIQISQSKQDLWKRFCLQVLEHKVGCIIDAGAILVGKSLENQIIPWMSTLAQFKNLKYKGISFCDVNGVWKVYDVSTYCCIERDTNIAEHQTFVIFDQARTRGADLKMKSDTVAALSLGPNMTKDKLMQAVGRLRKFGRNQKIIIFGTSDNLIKIEDLNINNQTTETQIIKVLKWVCSNTVDDNKKLLYPNSKLAQIHFSNIYEKNKVKQQQFDPSLKKMYEPIIKERSVAQLNQKNTQKYQKLPIYKSLIEPFVLNINKYGQNYNIKYNGLDDICERQVQIVEESFKQEEKENQILCPIQETDKIQISSDQISTIEFSFDQKLKFSRNFMNCTKYWGVFNSNKWNNQLCTVHYALIKNEKLLIITQREMSMELLKGMKCVGPAELLNLQEGDCIVRFSDLKLQTPMIKHYGLENALTDAQFFNGQQNFENINLILQTVTKNYNKLKKTLQEVITHFLDRRRLKSSRYQCSDLQKVFKKITNTIPI